MRISALVAGLRWLAITLMFVVSTVVAVAATAVPAASATATAAAETVDCPPGFYVNLTTSLCAAAPAGTYVPQSTTILNPTAPTPCPTGFYQELTGTTACTEAPPGYFVASSGSQTPTACPPGTVSGFASAACTEAPPGDFAVAGTEVLPCPSGATSTANGSSCTLGWSQVSNCPAGTTYSGGSCTDCPPGYFQPFDGQPSCYQAPAGTYATAGASSPTPCSAGSYSSSPASTTCEPAPLGEYAPVAGTSTPVPDPPGYYSNFQASNAPQQCTSGWYAPLSGSVTCTQAATGDYVPFPGMSTELACPSGTDPVSAPTEQCYVPGVPGTVVVVAASDASAHDGGAAPTVTPIYTNIAFDPASASTAPTCSAPGFASLVPGIYPGATSCSGATFQDYTVYEPGTLTVTGNPLAFSADSPPATFPASNPSYSYAFTATGGSGNYSFSLVNAPSWLSISPTGALSGSVPAGVWTFSYSVLLTDTLNNTSVTAGPFTVNEVDIPVTTVTSLTSVAYSAASQQVSVQATVAAANGPTVNEGTVAFTVVSSTNQTIASTTAAVQNGGADGSLGLPAATPTGVYSIDVSYTDPSGTFVDGGDSPANLVVDQAPAFTAASPPLSAVDQQPYSYAFSATGYPAPTYSLAANSPSWLSIDSATGTLSGTVPLGTTSFTYSIVASNGVSPAATAGPFTATAALPVSFAADSPPLTFPAGQRNYAYSFAGAEGSGLYSYALSGAPSWLSISPSTGMVSGTVPAGLTSFSYSATVTDATYGTSVTAGPFTVKEVAIAVTTSATPAITVYSAAAQNVSLLATVSSAGGPAVGEGTVTYKVVNGAAQTIASTTAPVVNGGADGSVTLPAATPAGSYTVNVSYTDPTGTFVDGGDTPSTLAVDRTPSFTTASPALSALDQQTYSYGFSATGYPAPTYSLAAGAPTWLTVNPSTGAVSGVIPAGATTFTYSVIASNGVGTPATAGPFKVTTSPFSLAFTGAYARTITGTVTTGSVAATTTSTGTLLLATANLTIHAVDGSTATVTTQVVDVLGVYVGQITVTDTADGIATTIAVILTKSVSLSSGYLTGTATGLRGTNVYNLAFTI